MGVKNIYVGAQLPYMARKQDELDKRKINIIYAMHKSLGGLTWSEVRDTFKLSSTTTSRVLKELQDSGEIKKQKFMHNREAYVPAKLIVETDRIAEGIKVKTSFFKELKKAGLFDKGMNEKDILEFVKKHQTHPEFKMYLRDKPLDRMTFAVYQIFAHTLSTMGNPVLMDNNPNVELKLKIDFNPEVFENESERTMKQLRELAKQKVIKLVEQ